MRPSFRSTMPLKGRSPRPWLCSKPGKSVGVDELKAFCLRNGAAYSHPRIIRIVEQLPLSGTGKVDRAAVRG
jgi:acyl-CoA synthetase (AMP-forming)/AMP-acid ligase II